MKNGNSHTNGTAANGEYSSPLEFPCDFIIKVMGKTDSAFEKNVVAIIKKHYPDTKDTQISKRPSKDNNYLAITATVYAESKEQLDALYKDLSNEPTILMAL